jgi:hypothetical protein
MNRLRIGRGCQVAGVVLIVLALALLGYLLAMPPRHGGRYKQLSCVNNLKQIGLAFRTWALDNDGQFPFNVSTNAGGTREFCAVGADGFDSNAVLHFQVMSNELSTPILLLCPEDWSRKRAVVFQSCQASNVTYWLHSGTNLNASNPTAVLAFCPVDGNTLHCDGSVTAGKADRKPSWSALMGLVRHKYLDWLAVRFDVVLVIGFVFLWAGSRLTWEARGGPKPLGLIIGEALLVILALLIITLIVSEATQF